LKNILLPLLRADFKISETYHYKGNDKFNCSISVLGGTDDDISLESLKSWGNFFLLNQLKLLNCLAIIFL
jgi:surfactin synthase thioesterase subunit